VIPKILIPKGPEPAGSREPAESVERPTNSG
jgi:hypothetical protein